MARISRTVQLIPQIRAAAARAGWSAADYTIHTTEYAGHARELARAAAQEAAQAGDSLRVWTAGGDGTFMEAMTGVQGFANAAVGCLPYGSGNDFLRKRPEAETIANLRAMLDEARARKLPVLLIATPRPGLGLSVPPFYANLAREYALTLEAESLAEILSSRSLKSDWIHPNAAGYRQLAGAIADRLNKAGALP